MTPDLYDTLGVARTADKDAVRKAFRKMAKSAHPDGGGDEERFALICLAVDVLGDDARRARYDATGQADAAGPDTVMADAMNCVMQAIQHVVDEIMKRGGDLGSFDVVSDARKKIRADIAACTRTRDHQKNEAAELRLFAKRFKAKKKKVSKIAPMILAQADAAERGAEMAVAKVPAMEMALAVLDDHEFDWQSPEARPQDRYTQGYPIDAFPWLRT